MSSFFQRGFHRGESRGRSRKVASRGSQIMARRSLPLSERKGGVGNKGSQKGAKSLAGGGGGGGAQETKNLIEGGGKLTVLVLFSGESGLQGKKKGGEGRLEKQKHWRGPRPENVHLRHLEKATKRVVPSA